MLSQHTDRMQMLEATVYCRMDANARMALHAQVTGDNDSAAYDSARRLHADASRFAAKVRY
jgi:hypothetical protein